MRPPRLRTVLTGAGATLVLIGGSTAAYAVVNTGPIDSSGVIHGCYKTTATANSHAVVLQNAGAVGALQYSAQAGSAIDEHVVVLDQNSTLGPVTFDLQMSAVNLSGVIECNTWGTAFPSTSLP